MTRPLSDLRIRIIGPGRAGRSLAGALEAVGSDPVGLLGRSDDASDALLGADIVLIATPDDVIADVAGALTPGPGVVAHMSGSRTLDVLEPHTRRASLHPLMSLPNAEIGAQRLLDGCTFAVCGDPLVRQLADALGGRAVEVSDADRARYHAAASIAANHVVALCAQVERLAASVGVPADAFWKLLQTSVDNVAELGSAAALTGPASRGDWATIRSHVADLPDGERALYLSLARAAADLADQQWPGDLEHE